MVEKSEVLACPECTRVPLICECFGDYFVFNRDSASGCFCNLHESCLSDSHFPFFGSEESCVEDWNRSVEEY